MTCEKIWWLLRHGERWLKPEKRGAGIMVRLGVTHTGTLNGCQPHCTSCLGHMPRLQCSLLLRTLRGWQTLEALMHQAAAMSCSRALAPLAGCSTADFNGPQDQHEGLRLPWHWPQPAVTAFLYLQMFYKAARVEFHPLGVVSLPDRRKLPWPIFMPSTF